jgi:hypothetical protein
MAKWCPATEAILSLNSAHLCLAHRRLACGSAITISPINLDKIDTEAPRILLL